VTDPGLLGIWGTWQNRRACPGPDGRLALFFSEPDSGSLITLDTDGRLVSKILYDPEAWQEARTTSGDLVAELLFRGRPLRLA